MLTLTWDRFKYSSRQFGLWRAVFGLYLTYYCARILPYGVEIYSRIGLAPDAARAARPSFFPVWLLGFDTPAEVQGILITCLICAALIMLGLFRRSAALVLWLLVAWLYNRAPYSDSPEYCFVNWLIFILIFIPIGEEFSLGKKDPHWALPPMFYWGAWIVLAVGYFYAGSSKFKGHDSSWMNGRAMYYVLATDNGRMSWYGDFYDSLPPFVFVALTYGAIGLQTFAGVFILFRRVRPLWWIAATSTHIGLLFFANLFQLTMGMILFHFFLFDRLWIDSAKATWKAIRR